jgi:hypothetical protein
MSVPWPGTLGFTTAGGNPSFLPSTYRLQTTQTFNVAGTAVGGGYTVRIQQTSAGIPLGAGGGNIFLDLDGANGTFVTFVTPEPSTWALLGTGLLTLGGVARRRRRTQG